MPQLSQLINQEQAEYALNQRLDVPNAYPLSVYLESTNVCNYRCPLCPVGAQLSRRSKGWLKRQIVEQVCAEIAGYVPEVVFSFYGEPMLHPDITEFVAIAKAHELRVKLFTNCSHVPKGGWDQFCAAGVDHLIISIDGVDQATYGHYRQGGHLEQVVNHLRTLVAIREQQQSHRPVLEVQMLATKCNETQWDDLIHLCVDCGVDFVKRKFTNLGPQPTDALAREYLPHDPALHYYDEARTTAIRATFHERAQSAICKELYLGPVVVGCDGQYILCCRDADGTVDLGACTNLSVWDFWNGPRMAEIRRRLREPAVRPALCGDCPALFLEEFVIARHTIRPPKPAVLDQRPTKIQSIQPEQVLEHVEPMVTPDIPTPDVLASVAKRSTPIRTFREGDLVDYGSYRVFKV